MIGDLDMANQRHQLSQTGHNRRFHSLHVVQVVLQSHVIRADTVKQRPCLGRIVDQKAGNIIAVDRFDIEVDSDG